MTKKQIQKWLLHAESQRDEHRRSSMAELLYQLQQPSQPAEEPPPQDNAHVAAGCQTPNTPANKGEAIYGPLGTHCAKCGEPWITHDYACVSTFHGITPANKEQPAVMGEAWIDTHAALIVECIVTSRSVNKSNRARNALARLAEAARQSTELRATNASLQAELDGMRAIVDKLPRTKDDVHVSYNATLFCPKGHDAVPCDLGVWWCHECPCADSGQAGTSFMADEVFSTRDAALAPATPAPETELTKLKLFKTNTHKLLDEAGVPQFETEECRVSHRIRWLAAENKRLEKALEEK